MSTAKMTGRLNFFVLLSGLVFLFFTCSTVLAATPEIEMIRRQIRNKHARWMASETSVTRLSAERRLRRIGLKRRLSATEGAVILSTPSVTQPSTTAYLNYADSRDVTPVRDQGDCGDCWAFATTAALESQVLIGNEGVGSSTLDLSEETLLSCCGAQLCGNCNGGYIDSASNFIKSTGLPPESCFPYLDYTPQMQETPACSDAACTFWQSDTDAIVGWGWVAVDFPTSPTTPPIPPTVDTMKNALTLYGPLVSTMNVYNDFYSYSGGVYSYVGGQGDTYQGAHAIEIVGYNDADQCFIVKNSWGAGWGETADGEAGGGGFFRIAYDQISSPVQFGYETIAYDGYTPLRSSCSYSISPASTTVTYTARDAHVSVSSQPDCPWQAVSNAGWIKIVSSAQSAGNGKVEYHIQKNTTLTSRTGTLTIAGQTFTVTQNGIPTSVRRRFPRFWW